MTRDEVIRMAREAGIVVTGEAVWKLCELVAAAERERCAKACEEMDESLVTIYGTDYTDFHHELRYLQMAADAIRKGE